MSRDELIFPTLECVHKTALQYPLFTLENDRCHKTFPSVLGSYFGHIILLTLLSTQFCSVEWHHCLFNVFEEKSGLGRLMTLARIVLFSDVLAMYWR